MDLFAFYELMPTTRVVVLGMLHTGHGGQAPQHKHQKHLQPGNPASMYRYDFRKWYLPRWLPVQAEPERLKEINEFQREMFAYRKYPFRP